MAASTRRRGATRADEPRRRAGVLTGQDALGDWTTDAPGVRRRITIDDLAKPFDTPSANNFPRPARRPAGAMPRAPKGFQVSEFATGLRNPRKIVTAPNGDIFVAESMPGRIKVLRDADGDGKAELNEVFATGLSRPFGIAFYPAGPNPTHVYVGNTDSVVRFAYQNGDTKARDRPRCSSRTFPAGESRSAAAATGPATSSSRRTARPCSSRSARGRTSATTRAKRGEPTSWPSTPTARTSGSTPRASATPSAWRSTRETGQLWASVNERDALGDHLVPDYVTHVEEGGFYGWPWYYLGANQDPRHKGKHPELKDKVIVPDVLVQSHSASLCMTFYTGSQFPKEYRLDAFAAEHGSWNRARRTGYKVIRIPMKDGKATGEYEDFLVGFVTPEGNVWGRPVGVTVAKDGALLVTDDGSGIVWRVAYTGLRTK